MARLECPGCGYRMTVPDSETKFGMDCPECQVRRMGPPRVGPLPPPLGGVGNLPMAVVRPLAGAPMAALAAAAFLYCGGISGLLLFVMLSGMAVYLLATGLAGFARYRG